MPTLADEPSILIHSCSLVYFKSVGYAIPFASVINVVGSSGLFGPLVERSWNYLGSYGLPADLHLQGGSHRPKRERNIRQRNVLLQKRSGRAAGNVANIFSGFAEHLVAIARDAALHHLEPDQGSRQARSFRFLQRSPPDEVRLLHFAEAVEARLPHV